MYIPPAEYTRSEAAKLHSMGVRVVPVGFGGVIDQSELALWASDDVTSVMGLDDVTGIMGQVCSVSCNIFVGRGPLLYKERKSIRNKA